MIAVSILAMAAAILLLGVNLAGLMIRPYGRVRALPNFPRPAAAVPPVVGPQPGDGWQDHLRRLVDFLNTAIVHYTGANEDAVSPFDNWILWALKFTGKAAFRRYHFVRASRALRRGYGLCSQHALTLVQLLKRVGIEANVAGFEGHVVAVVKRPDESWILADADYRVIVPRPIEEIRRDPACIEPFYAATQTPAARIAVLQGIYAGPMTLHSSRRRSWRLAVEDAAYGAKWLVPLLLLAAAAAHLWTR